MKFSTIFHLIQSGVCALTLTLGAVHADYLRHRFNLQEVRTVTLRDDAPKAIREAATEQLRTAVRQADYVYSVSLFPSLGINSYFIVGNQSEFPSAQANAAFGSGTVVTKLSEVKRPSELMAFISARSAVSGDSAQGYFQVTPPCLKSRLWKNEYSPAGPPIDWGFVAPRFNQGAVAAMMDGHVERLNFREVQDMNHWCNTADHPDFLLQTRQY